MKRKRLLLPSLFIAATFFAIFPVFGQSSTPQETLNEYIPDVQKNPNDYALREKIIKFVQTMNPAPVVPEAVDELIGQAKYVFKHAKEQKDYLDAVDAYKKVVNFAREWQFRRPILVSSKGETEIAKNDGEGGKSICNHGI
jgi:hypothetical protein